jgi:opacity protein-like surface antigen
VAGLKYLIPISGSGRSPIGKAQPYIMAGGGIAKVQNNVAFTIGGTDVTANLQQYGVALGADLSGSVTKAMLTLGGGVTLPVWQRLILDFQYRYGRIFTDDQAITAQRAGLGLGIGF